MIEINLNSIFYDVVHRFKALTPGIMVHWEVFFSYLYFKRRNDVVN